MKSICKTLAICIGLVALQSCSSDKAHKQIPNIEIQEAEELVFPLDDSTVETIEYMQFFQRNDSNILAFTNNYDNAIVFYNYDTRKYLNRISYHKQGGDGIGNIFAFYYFNKDSIFHYHYNLRTLFLTNQEGKVLERHRIDIIPNPSPDSLFIAPILFPRTLSPITLIDDEIILAGFLMGEVEGETEKNRPVMTYYNLKTKTWRHSDSYPSVYHKGFWGGDFTWRNPYYTLSPQNEVILSFAAHSKIRVHSATNNIFNEYYAGIGEQSEIKPIDENIPTNMGIPDNIKYTHYVGNISYGGILYDKYRDVYYRIALLPDNNININKLPLRKPVEIIVLNNQFEIIGKGKLPKYDYWINQCFVGQEGLHIQVHSEDEDKLIFKTFVIDPHESK